VSDTNANPSVPPVPTTIAELLRLIRTERSALEAAVDRLDATALTAVASPGGWSIKDHLMHLVAWEEILLGKLAGVPEYVTLGLEEEVASTIKLDELNNLFYQRHRDIPLPTVLESFATIHQKVLAALSRLSDEDLAMPCQPNDPKSPTWVDEIRWNTSEHYREHRGWLGI
jgi:hypothetical protein